MRRIGVSAAVMAVSLLVAAPAGAATLHGENGTVTYTAAPGHDNVVQFAPDGPGRVQFTHPDHRFPGPTGPDDPDDGDPVLATGSCAKDESTTYMDRFICTDITVGVVADAGDGDDELGSLLPNLQTRLYGGEGNDQLLDYQPGIPVVTAETFDGGPGDDEIVSHAGADAVIGGPGTDIVRMNIEGDPPQPVSITLDGVANDGAPGTGVDIRPDVENVSAGSVSPFRGDVHDPQGWPTFGPLTIVGNAGPNALTAYSPGTLTGGEGPDTLTGSIYDDTIDAADGSADVVHCLDGNDTARVDGFDTVALDCETVTYPERVAPTGMTIAVKAARRARFTVTGRVARPRTVTARRACGAGRIRITVTARKRKVATRTAKLRANCSYRRTFAVRRSLRGRLRFGARYAGNAVLASASAKAVSARVRR